MPDTLVLYDADPDGFGSAWAAWKYFGDSADYVEVMHGQELPLFAFSYERVYILDLSFKREDLVDLRNNISFLMVIDHHASAKDMLNGLGIVPWPVRTDRSACTQAWRFFSPGTNIPMLLQYIEDRDLWLWKMRYSEAMNAMIFNTDKTFKAWDELASAVYFEPEKLVRAGRNLLVYRDRLVDMIVENHFMYHGIPTVAAPVLHSEVGHKLLDMYPDAPYVQTYTDNVPEGKRKYSMRSEDHREDVSVIAKKYGGGGHRNAAGYSVLANVPLTNRVQVV